jgi:hypothetical protein
MIQRVEDVKRPLKIGERYIVPCIIKESFNGITKDLLIIPVINKPHSDKENGQSEIHYHIDTRFIDTTNSYFKDREDVSMSLDSFNSRPQNKIDGIFDRFVLPVFNETFGNATPSSLVRNSKLKHKCIHKGKCPHRGMDLSQVEPVDGVITCPLHSLQFDAKTKQLKK